MKTIVLPWVSRICLIVGLAAILQSCVRYEVAQPRHTGLDGRAFVRLNWYDFEPSYVDADDIVPSNFYWDKYYSTVPGYYSVYYEYTYRDGYGSRTNAYKANVRVWINYGTSGSYGYNGADNYFDLDLYPDGYSDFKLKACTDDAVATTDTTVFKTVVLAKGNTTIEVSYQRAMPRKH